MHFLYRCQANYISFNLSAWGLGLGLGSYAALQQLYRIDTIFYLVIAEVEIGWARGCTKIVEYSNLISFINELENGKLKTSIQNECRE